MLRLTELKLPLDHAEAELKAALLRRLGLAAADLIGFSVFRRAVDARKKSAIALIYTLDVAVRDEKALLKGLQGDRNVSVAPDMDYRFVTRAPANAARPVIIGTGPCGLLAALVLAPLGFRPIILERGKVVRERTKDTSGLWRESVLNPESNVQFGEGGAGTFSDGKLYRSEHPGAWQGRSRTDQGYLGPVARIRIEPGIECSIRRRRSWHIFRRQALQIGASWSVARSFANGPRIPRACGANPY